MKSHIVSSLYNKNRVAEVWARENGGYVVECFFKGVLQLTVQHAASQCAVKEAEKWNAYPQR